MQLDILACRHMPDSGGILLSQFCNPAQLICCQSAEGDLDTHHLDTDLSLAINAVLETEGPEQIDRDVPRNHAHRLSLECLDLLNNGRRNGLCLDGNCTERCATHR